MRPWAEKTYGIPPDQVIGTISDVKFQMRTARRSSCAEAKIAVHRRRPGQAGRDLSHHRAPPHRAFGNSDGDLQMLQFTAAGPGRRFMLIVHHDDAEREYAYDRQSHIGKLDKAWDEAKAKGWTVVSMKNDWKTIFAFRKVKRHRHEERDRPVDRGARPR